MAARKCPVRSGHSRPSVSYLIVRRPRNTQDTGCHRHPHRKTPMIEPNPFETLRQIAGGYCLSRGLHVVADLAVADKLDETPRTAAELAVSVGAHPEALGRVLRLLSAHGVFESCGGKFRHSPASRM